MPNGEQTGLQQYEVTAPDGTVGTVSETDKAKVSGGYKLTGRLQMFAPDGARGFVDPQHLSEATKAGYTLQPKTQFEKEHPGKGISLEGAGGAAWDVLKGMVPPDPTGGHSIFSKEAWIGDKSPTFDPAHSGIAEAGREAVAGWQHETGIPGKVAGAGMSGLASLFGLGSEKRASEHAARGEGGAIIGEAAVPAGMAIAGYALPKVVPKAMAKVFPKVDPLRKINELLGVQKQELRVGKAPETTDAFITNPARGAAKAGLDEKALAKMNPLERNKAIVAAKDTVGKQLQSTLDAATQQGKRLSLRSTVDNVFKEIPDKNIQAQTRTKLTQIVNKALGRPNVFEKVPYTKLLQDLDNLTPSQAREIQRGLDDFANFAGEGTVKSFKDVATRLRRGISVETRKLVPESAPFDQQYGDLANASKATERLVKDFAMTTPESKLRKMIVKGLFKAAKAASGVPLP